MTDDIYHRCFGHNSTTVDSILSHADNHGNPFFINLFKKSTDIITVDDHIVNQNKRGEA